MFECYKKTGYQPPKQEIKSYAAATKGATNTASHKYGQSIFAFSMDPSGMDKEFHIELIDILHDAKAAGNPIPAECEPKRRQRLYNIPKPRRRRENSVNINKQHNMQRYDQRSQDTS